MTWQPVDWSPRRVGRAVAATDSLEGDGYSRSTCAASPIRVGCETWRWIFRGTVGRRGGDLMTDGRGHALMTRTRRGAREVASKSNSGHARVRTTNPGKKPAAGRRTRRDRILLGGLAASVVVPIVILVGVAVASKADQDWARVASVNGVAIDRARLRDEMAFQRFLLAEELDAIKRAELSGKLDAATAATHASALQAAFGDEMENATSALVDAELIRQLAAREGITAGQPDPIAELKSYLGSAYSRHVRFVTISPDVAPAGGGSVTTPEPGADPVAAFPRGKPQEAAEQASAELASGASLSSVVAALRTTGYEATSDDRWLGSTGPINGVDTSLLVGVRTADTPGAIGPMEDRRGRFVAGALIEIAEGVSDEARLIANAAQAGVATSTIAEWARVMALREALSSAITDRLVSMPVMEVRGRELVIGPAEPAGATSGPWVELAALELEALGLAPPPPGSEAPADTMTPLPSVDPSLPPSFEALMSDLRVRTPEGRVALFQSLAAIADARSGNATNANGELGFLARADLEPVVGDAVFASGVERGDVIGPVSLKSQHVLFLVEARYAGVLDLRSRGALAEARAPGADLATLAERISPADIALAHDSGWFSKIEFMMDDAFGGTLFGTPAGGLSDPVVLDGQLALLSPSETRTAAPTNQARDRLVVNGFTSWFARERANATIVVDIASPPADSPIASESTGPIQTIEPLITPFVPSIPGLPAASSAAVLP